MKRNCFLLLCAFSGVWPGYVSATEAELVELENAVAAAVLSADLEFLDGVYADDFRFSHSTGDVDTKSSWIELLRENPGYYTERRVDRIDVEMHGNVALTAGRIHSRTTSTDPRWQEYSIWYIRFYEKQDGQWRLLSHRSIREEQGPIKD